MFQINPRNTGELEPLADAVKGYIQEIVNIRKSEGKSEEELMASLLILLYKDFLTGRLMRIGAGNKNKAELVSKLLDWEGPVPDGILNSVISQNVDKYDQIFVRDANTLNKYWVECSPEAHKRVLFTIKENFIPRFVGSGEDIPQLAMAFYGLIAEMLHVMSEKNPELFQKYALTSMQNALHAHTVIRYAIDKTNKLPKADAIRIALWGARLSTMKKIAEKVEDKQMIELVDFFLAGHERFCQIGAFTFENQMTQLWKAKVSHTLKPHALNHRNMQALQSRWENIS